MPRLASLAVTGAQAWSSNKVRFDRAGALPLALCLTSFTACLKKEARAEDGDNDEEQDDEEDAESLAASDVAVAASAVASLRQRDDSSPPAARPPLSYPKPKNFAERLMGAMESGEVTDSIWWAGNGTLVAFYPKKIKNGETLETHLRLKNYNSFIRSLNRW